MSHCDYALHIDDSVSHGMLRSLDEVVEGRYRFLIADSPEIALRGLDFRSPNNAILFVTMRSFAHYREMVQAASRVGRQEDQCRRMIVGDIDLVDHLASCAYKRKLISFIDSVSAQHQAKKNERRKTHAVQSNPFSANRTEAARPGAQKRTMMATNQQALDDFFKKVAKVQKRQRLDGEHEKEEKID